jgi:hypothetical protein
MTAPHSTIDPNAWLMGGGGKSAKFESLGEQITGAILDLAVKQQTNFDTGKPEFWDNGDPKMQLVVTLSTDQRDPGDKEDDGERRLYVKGNLQKAIQAAVRSSGATGLEIGGQVTVTFTGEGEPPRRGANPPKLYSAAYVPAATVALMAGAPPAPAPTVPAPAQPTAPPAAPIPTAGGIDPAALAALANLTPEQRAALGL